MPLLKLSLLGSFQAVLDGQPITQFKGDKVRALLAYLAAEADRPHERSSLVSLFWPNMPEGRALRNLSQTLIRLRDAIHDEQAHPPFLLVTRHEVRWNTQADQELDATEFERLLKAGREETGSDAESALAKGMALYRGDFLRGFGLSDCPDFEDWLLLKREQYHHLALEALQKLADARLAAGDYAQARGYAHQQIGLEPWREIAHRQLMRALALGGHRSEALAQYETCQRTLAQELGIEPEAETVTLYEQIRSGKLDTVTVAPASSHLVTSSPQHNLPAQLTPFIGREEELAQLDSLLRDPERRLITLIGLGGVGKTRLALVAARALIGVFAHGVWFVPLAGVGMNAGAVAADARDEHARHALARAIADALGLTLTGQESAPAQLLNCLRSREVLLVLDNYEHLLASAEFLATLLRTAPHVKVFVTSRERLNVEGEATVPLQGMPVPANAAEQELASAGCVRLFVERAQRTSARFNVNANNLSDILHVCKMVEGLPLGIELAASWVQHYSLREIVHAIQDNLNFLASPRSDRPSRQSSLRAVFDYSWRMLSPLEQRALAQLSIFRSAFSREAALAVTGARLLTLVALADKSLLHQSGEGRYAMHELVRQFAGEQLQQMASAEPDLPNQAHARHSDYSIEFVGAQSEGLYGSLSRQTLATIQAESDNLNQALQWAMSHGRWRAIDRHIVEILRIYHFQMNYGEGLALAQQLIRHAEDQLRRDPQSVPPHLLSKLLAEQAFLLTFQGTPREAIVSAQAVIEQTHRAGDSESELAGYLDWGLQEYYLGNYDSAQNLLEKAHALAQTISQTTSGEQTPGGQAGAPTRRQLLLKTQAMRYLAALRIVQGRAEKAGEYELEIVKAYRQLHHLWGEARTMMFFGDSHFIVWNYTKAREYYELALRICRDMGSAHGQCHMHIELSRIAMFQSDFALARQQGERALAIIQDTGNVMFHAYALATLSGWAHRMGECERAYDLAQEAAQIIQKANYPLLVAYCLERLGDALTSSGRQDEAAAAYQRVLDVQREIGSAALIMMTLANNARLALLRGELAQSQTYANEALELLKTHGLSGAPEPWRIYFDLYRVLHVVGDQRSLEMLDKAFSLLQDQAAKIGDAAMRQSFLCNVGAHREIQAERRRLGLAG
jgi:DNA-binding SARP family transcriptional activator/predicted ATPase